MRSTSVTLKKENKIMTKEMERIKEIEERKAALRAEIAEGKAEEERLGQIKEEAEKLSAEEEEIRSKVALNSALAPGSVPEDENRAGSMTEREKRAKEFVQSGRTEFRAVLSTGQIAKPTKAGGVNGLAEVASGIVDDVNAVPLTGNGAWTAAYKKTDAIAAAVTDGQTIGGTGSTYDYVTINPAEWGVLDEISNQVAKLTPLSYQDSIEQSALIALRATAADKIVTAITASAIAESKVVLLDSDFLRTLALGFRAIPGKGDVRLYIAQADLLTLGKVRGTNEKRPLYEIEFDPGTTTSGIIKEGGLALKFRVLDNLTTGTQLFGQPGAVDLCMWDNYKIETNDGGDYFKRNMIGIRGLQTAGADLVAYHGMQVITQE